jgi:hypothetical protein
LSREAETCYALTVEQTKRIDALTAENTELKTRLETLERRIGGNALTKAE